MKETQKDLLKKYGSLEELLKKANNGEELATPKQAEAHKRRMLTIEEDRERYELEQGRLAQKYELESKRLAERDAVDQKRHERKMREIAGTSHPTPTSETIDPQSLNSCMGKDQGVKFPKSKQPMYTGTDTENWLKGTDHYPIPDFYGYISAWDWTPEQIAEMEKKIPCRGVLDDSYDWLDEVV